MCQRSKLSGIKISVLIAIVVQMFLAFTVSDVFSAAKSSDKRVRYVAHRGWSSRAPENTLAAISLAAGKKGFYGVEFDVWESSIEKKVPLLLVMHDPNISRMCGVKKDIRSISRSNLKKYKIRKGKNVNKYRNQRIPTVDQALDTIWAGSKGAIPVIELKHRLSKKGLDYLLNKVEGHKAIIISFEYNALLDAVKRADKRGMSDDITTMYLVKKMPEKKCRRTATRLRKAGIDGISIKYKSLKKATVKTFHRSGIEVGAWTLPNRKTAKKYVRMGVDYITSNGVVY